MYFAPWAQYYLLPCLGIVDGVNRHADVRVVSRCEVGDAACRDTEAAEGGVKNTAEHPALSVLHWLAGWGQLLIDLGTSSPLAGAGAYFERYHKAGWMSIKTGMILNETRAPGPLGGLNAHLNLMNSHLTEAPCGAPRGMSLIRWTFQQLWIHYP